MDELRESYGCEPTYFGKVVHEYLAEQSIEGIDGLVEQMDAETLRRLAASTISNEMLDDNRDRLINGWVPAAISRALDLDEAGARRLGVVYVLGREPVKATN